MNISNVRPKVCIVILNWNGWKDTIACLESILCLKGVDFFIALVDNASSDQSVNQIREWAALSQLSSVGLTFVELLPEAVANTDFTAIQRSDHTTLCLICSDVNLGFAAGCNLGSRLALASGADYIWFLNNDTIVEADSLSRQVHYLENNPSIQATTGQIRYFDRPVIWNCGGWLTWFGSRKYLYHGASVDQVPQSGNQLITFVTGCALLIRSRVFKEMGFFSERFFFGEEDYEFSQRLKRQNQQIACCFDAVIYHKVSASVKHASDKTANLWYINYLNRFIDMRSYMSRRVWHVWRFVSLAYILTNLKLRYHASSKVLFALGRALLRDSAQMDGVSREHFEKTMRFGFEYQS